MKKILVMSDSHGDVVDMIETYEKEKPDLVIHLGDCVRDVERFREACPNAKVEGVPGNCDMSFDQPTRILIYEGFRIMITHGHMYHVKMDTFRIELAAQEKQANVALFGHTHQVYYAHHNGCIYLNPGSIGAPRMGNPASYGLLYLDGQKKDIRYEIKYLE